MNDSSHTSAEASCSKLQYYLRPTPREFSTDSGNATVGDIVYSHFDLEPRSLVSSSSDSFEHVELLEFLNESQGLISDSFDQIESLDRDSSIEKLTDHECDINPFGKRLRAASLGELECKKRSYDQLGDLKFAKVQSLDDSECIENRAFEFKAINRRYQSDTFYKYTSTCVSVLSLNVPEIGQIEPGCELNHVSEHFEDKPDVQVARQVVGQAEVFDDEAAQLKNYSYSSAKKWLQCPRRIIASPPRSKYYPLESKSSVSDKMAKEEGDFVREILGDGK